MPIIYDGLFKLLEKRDMKISEFRYNKTLSSATIAKLRKNQPVNISVLDLLCEKLGCGLDDIAEYRPVQCDIIPDAVEPEEQFILHNEEEEPQSKEQTPDPAINNRRSVADNDPYITSVSGIYYRKSRLESDKINFPHKFIANKDYPNICSETGYAYRANVLCVIERPDNPDE